SPLTLMASKAIEASSKDPAFRKIEEKAIQLAELHRQIIDFEPDSTDNPPGLSRDDLALLDQYADILNSIGSLSPSVDAGAQQSNATENPQRKQFQFRPQSLDDLISAYREKAEEMNRALASLTPPPDFTPEEQRNYFSARKVMTAETDMRWKCNLCGALHMNPTDCARPELGGEWIVVSQTFKIE
ncbi:MAG: hypothetical protein K2K55_07015, partial [Duncaniella sp.]|nr:hypothetical protein [Duncaniella sp.]